MSLSSRGKIVVVCERTDVDIVVDVDRQRVGERPGFDVFGFGRAELVLGHEYCKPSAASAPKEALLS